MKRILLKLFLSFIFILFVSSTFSIVSVNSEPPNYTYFNPDIPYPEDPCDTGGISVCYGN
jgi:hypothetical protein